jgi:hypothetical protein
MARGGREGVGAAQARGDRRGGGGLVRGRGGALVRVMGGGGAAAAAPQSEPETPLASPTPLRAAAHAAPRALLRHRPRGSGGTRWTEGDRWRERGWGGLSVVSSRARAPEGCASLAAAPEAVKLDTAEGGRGGRGGAVFESIASISPARARHNHVRPSLQRCHRRQEMMLRMRGQQPERGTVWHSARGWPVLNN